MAAVGGVAVAQATPAGLFTESYRERCRLQCASLLANTSSVKVSLLARVREHIL